MGRQSFKAGACTPSLLPPRRESSGKTTLSGHLAVEANRHGAGAVALIDTDPQGSLAHWWNARKADEPHFVKVRSCSTFPPP